MGAGIIINSVLAISPTAMQVSLTVNSAAAVGPRTVTVTTGSQVLTLAGGVVVTPSLSVTQTSGVFAQGGSAVLQARLAPGKNFTPVVAGSTLAVGNATFGLPTGLTTIDNRWLGSDLAEVTVSLSPFASG